MTGDLRAIIPELLLGTLALGLLLIDLLTDPSRKRVVGWVGVVGLVVALAPTAGLFSGPPRLVFAETYAVDPFAAFFKLIAITSGILVLVAAMEFYRDRATHYEGEIYSLVVFMVLGLALLSAAVDLILLFLAFEFVSLVSYVLAGSLKGDRKSNEAGVKYFFYGASASAVMLYAFTFLYGASGTTNLYHLMQHVAFLSPGFLTLAVMLMLAGFGFKISLVPFHQWTPDVYEGAPTPIVAFLSVGSKAAAFAALLRVLYVAMPLQGWVTIVAGLAAISMTLGNLVALSQRNIKRMLAYSSIAHAGYMLIGVVAVVASPTPVGSGVAALLFYLLAYTFTNIGAFGVATVIGRELGSDEISDYAGLSRRAPFSAFAMAVFMLSLTGIPPTALFFGKFLLFGAAINSGLLWLAVVGILTSVVSLVYYIGVVRAMYLMPAPEGAPVLQESGPARALLAVTLLGTMVMGIFPQPFIRLVNAASIIGRF
jgi:proton-translocating NADH-quinone oxidoreductase chain N